MSSGENNAEIMRSLAAIHDDLIKLANETESGDETAERHLAQAKAIMELRNKIHSWREMK